MRMRKPLARQDQALRNKEKRCSRSPPASQRRTPPFKQIMQNLLPLVGLMRNMSLEGGATARNPKLILTGSGLELCFSDPDTPSAQARAGRRTAWPRWSAP